MKRKYTEVYREANKRKTDQLGMPHGTASSRLRKLILFDLLVRHKENICYHCGLPISTAEELSTEHKKPWQGQDTSLFWNLDNIGFSHLSCNVGAARRVYPANIPNPRKVGPEGTSWCVTHQDFIPIEKFGASKHRWNGLSQDCKECRKVTRNKSVNYAGQLVRSPTGN